MGTKSKPRNTKNTNNNNNNNNVIGKGNVTPIQVAFIVDRYLADNNFTKTRSVFHSEAASVSKFDLNKVPKSLLNLWELLEEYILLKEEKLLVDQQKCGLAQEMSRIQTLLHGMQGVMNTYNSSAAATTATATAANCLMPPPPPVIQSVPETSVPITSCAGYPEPITPVMTLVSMTPTVNMDCTNFVTPTTGGRPPRKRRANYKVLEDAPHAPKRVYSGPLANYPFSRKVSKTGEQSSITRSSKQFPPLQSSSSDFAQGGLPIHGSSVAKNLFDKPPHSPNSNSSSPKTPPQVVSTPNDKSTSLLNDVSTAISHHSIAPPETTPTNCTIISSKTIIVSPAKSYSIERSQCTFSSPAKRNSKQQSERNHVKGRLDFDSSDIPSCSENVSGDGSTTSESEKEGDVFDMDLSAFDAFGSDFSLSSLLTEFGIDCGNLDHSCPAIACDSSGAMLESLHERNNGELGTSRDLIELSSTEVAGDKTVNGLDSITSVTSVRKCLRIVSPTKSSRNSSVHFEENLCGRS